MKKGKIIGYSILGGGVIFLSYVIYKKFKNKKALVSEEEFDFGLPMEQQNNIKKIVAVQEDMRPIISNLSNATTEEEAKKLGLDIIEVVKDIKTVEGRNALVKWYESRNSDKNSKFTTTMKNLTKGVKVPLGRYGADVDLYEVIQRQFSGLDWKNA